MNNRPTNEHDPGNDDQSRDDTLRLIGESSTPAVAVAPDPDAPPTTTPFLEESIGSDVANKLRELLADPETSDAIKRQLEQMGKPEKGTSENPLNLLETDSGRSKWLQNYQSDHRPTTLRSILDAMDREMGNTVTANRNQPEGGFDLDKERLIDVQRKPYLDQLAADVKRKNSRSAHNIWAGFTQVMFGVLAWAKFAVEVQADERALLERGGGDVRKVLSPGRHFFFRFTQAVAGPFSTQQQEFIEHPVQLTTRGRDGGEGTSTLKFNAHWQFKHRNARVLLNHLIEGVDYGSHNGNLGLISEHGYTRDDAEVFLQKCGIRTPSVWAGFRVRAVTGIGKGFFGKGGLKDATSEDARVLKDVLRKAASVQANQIVVLDDHVAKSKDIAASFKSKLSDVVHKILESELSLWPLESRLDQVEAPLRENNGNGRIQYEERGGSPEPRTTIMTLQQAIWELALVLVNRQAEEYGFQFKNLHIQDIEPPEEYKKVQEELMTQGMKDRIKRHEVGRTIMEEEALNKLAKQKVDLLNDAHKSAVAYFTDIGIDPNVALHYQTEFTKWAASEKADNVILNAGDTNKILEGFLAGNLVKPPTQQGANSEEVVASDPETDGAGSTATSTLGGDTSIPDGDNTTTEESPPPQTTIT